MLNWAFQSADGSVFTLGIWQSMCDNKGKHPAPAARISPLCLRMPDLQTPSSHLKKRQRVLTALLLLIWAIVSFGPGFFARSLSLEIWGWPFHFWMAAQGSILIFLAIVVVYAWLMNRWEAQAPPHADSAPHADKTLR